MALSTSTSATRVLVVGAGAAGAQILRETQKGGAHAGITVVGFVDDDEKKRGRKVRGVPVVGAIRDIPRVIRAHRVDQILVSTPSIGGDVAQRVITLAPPGFPIKILPSIASVILGSVDLSYVRTIDIADLIGRPLVKAAQRRIAREAAGKTFLVFGGAGSIGSEIVRQLHDSRAKRIVVVDSWEEGVYNLHEEFGNKTNKRRPAFEAFIGNIRDRARVDEIMGAHRYDVIVHAAAYKHLSLMEDNPSEAHKTNINGTKNILELAHKHGITDLTFISTDKAVRPTSVMGKTKRAAELLVQAHARKHPKNRFCIVRFGNVLNSSGSVVPKFLRQIRNREALTITHKDATRYFMSIPEAVSLVLQSRMVAKNGDVMVLDMGAPVKILDIAKNLITLHGLEPHKHITIQETGLRPGEKLHEELFYDATAVRHSPLAGVFIGEELRAPASPARARSRGRGASRAAARRGSSRARKSRARTNR